MSCAQVQNALFALCAALVLPQAARAQAVSAVPRATAEAKQAQDRATLMRYCDRIDSVSASTLQGIRDRSDCWKRIQLEGLGSALVEERYQSAVRAYDSMVQVDSFKRAVVAREARVDQELLAVQQFIIARDLDAAMSAVNSVLSVQSQNPRAQAFRERIFALRQAQQLRVAVYVASGLVLLTALILVLSAWFVALRQSRANRAEREKAALRRAMVKITDGIGRGKMYTIDGALFRIGSALSDRPEEKNDLVLSDETAYVSRYHCAILRKDGNYYLIDSSLNGTYLNEDMVDRGEPYLIEDGDELSVAGMARLKFLLV